jgi:hypothetical protein
MSTRQERLNGKPTPEDDFLNEINEPVEIAPEVIETVSNDVDFDSLFSRFDNETPEEMTGEILTAKNMEVNKPYNFIATGFTTIADKVTGEPRKALKMINREKETFICAAFVLMSSIEKIEIDFPYPIRLISLGTKEGKNNNYWNLKVYKL